MIDQELDEDVLALVAGAFDGTHVTQDAVAAMARRRGPRRRRRVVPALATAGIAAASLGIALMLGGGAPHADAAAFSVRADPQTGAVAVRIYQFDDATGLQQALADAGVHSIVHVDPVPTQLGPCTWTGVTTELDRMVTQLRGTDDAEELFIYPAQLPRGSVYGINYYVLRNVGMPDLHMVEFSQLSGEPTGCVGHSGLRVLASNSAR